MFRGFADVIDLPERAGWAMSASFSHLVVCGLAPFFTGVGYLLTESLEATLAERMLVSAGDTEAKEVSG